MPEVPAKATNPWFARLIKVTSSVDSALSERAEFEFNALRQKVESLEGQIAEWIRLDSSRSAVDDWMKSQG